jgi:hypothetical protein
MPPFVFRFVRRIQRQIDIRLPELAISHSGWPVTGVRLE